VESGKTVESGREFVTPRLIALRLARACCRRRGREYDPGTSGQAGLAFARIALVVTENATFATHWQLGTYGATREGGDHCGSPWIAPRTCATRNLRSGIGKNWTSASARGYYKGEKVGVISLDSDVGYDSAPNNTDNCLVFWVRIGL
jgi:hypothetical protein